jgi:hypothetical protein
MQIKARFIGGGRHIGTTLLGYRYLSPIDREVGPGWDPIDMLFLRCWGKR